ncbi:unnamed protein product [Prorocentrum cordatum]|uniref:Uncharacterized protein n=1 Tax=Prorocentrum cordatum TaxID=2364126 RepID=A0ABN9PFL1_9DINO|nr:unnamed protein product [Polarella glacialis]
MAYLAALAAQAAPEPRARRRAGRQGRSSALPISTRLEMGARIGAWVEEQAGAGIHYTRMPWGALATNMFNLTPSNAVARRLKRVYAEWAGKSKAGRLTPAGAGAEDRQQRRRRSDDPQERSQLQRMSSLIGFGVLCTPNPINDTDTRVVHEVWTVSRKGFGDPVLLLLLLLDFSPFLRVWPQGPVVGPELFKTSPGEPPKSPTAPGETVHHEGVRVDSLRPGLGDGGRPGRSGGRRRRPAPAHQPVRPWRRGPVPQTVAASRPAGDVRHGGSESVRVRDHFA